MRVLMFVKRVGGTGGLQTQARQVARRLLDAGVACEIVAHERKPLAAGTRATPEGVPLHVLVARRNPLFYARLLRFMRDARDRYDVVHVHGFGEDSLVAALGAWWAGRKPVVVKPSTAGPGTKLARWGTAAQRVPLLGRGVRAGVTRWVAISTQTREDLLRLGVPPERIALVPNGVDTDQFRPAQERERAELRARFAAPPEALVAVCIARLAPHKRLDLVLRALSRNGRELPEARLWIMGQGEERERLERLAAEYGIAERVAFLGAVGRTEVAERLRAADLFILGSLWEGLSNALLEAMASGLPVLATRVSGTEDLIVSGENGLLVEPDDEAALAAGLRRLVRAPGAAAALGRRARETAVEQYSLEATTRSLARLYEECVQEAEGGRRKAEGARNRSTASAPGDPGSGSDMDAWRLPPDASKRRER